MTFPTRCLNFTDCSDAGTRGTVTGTTVGAITTFTACASCGVTPDPIDDTPTTATPLVAVSPYAIPA